MNRFRIGEHTSADLNLLATRSITAEAKSLNHVPHFFPTTPKVDQYNDNVLHNSTCEKVIITAIDIPPSGSSPKFKQQLQAALDKHKPESTGGLPKVITVAVNHQYDIISNIAVQDGIMNGAECCIKYIQPQAHDSTFTARFTCWQTAMAKIQLFIEYTHTPRLDPNICPKKVISHQGCMGYTCPVPNAQCSSTYHTCCTKCNI